MGCLWRCTASGGSPDVTFTHYEAQDRCIIMPYLDHSSNILDEYAENQINFLFQLSFVPFFQLVWYVIRLGTNFMFRIKI